MARGRRRGVVPRDEANEARVRMVAEEFRPAEREACAFHWLLQPGERCAECGAVVAGENALAVRSC